VRPVRYNRTVLDAERSAERFERRGGTSIVLRFAGFYGPDSVQLHDMVKLARRGWAPLPGAADAYWSSVSHDDAASAVLAALAVPSGIYNVCDDEPLTRRALADALADAFGLPHPKLLPAWTVHLMGSLGELMARSQRMSNRKLRAHGWAPRYPSVREGFRAVAEATAVSRSVA
jgi:nucleoside-diphosphate-sugar epimerase